MLVEIPTCILYAKREGDYKNVMCAHVQHSTHGKQVAQSFHFVFLLICSPMIYTPIKDEERKQYFNSVFLTILIIILKSCK